MLRARVPALAGVLPVACALAGVALAPAAAHADTRLATTAEPLTLSADAGALAWLRQEGKGRHRFVVVPARDAAPRAIGPALPSARPFDVARVRGGEAAIVWAEGCSTATHRCTVRTLPVAGGAARTLTRIPYAGGGAPAVTQDGARLAYAVATFKRAAGQRVECDVPYTRLLTGSAAVKRPRRLSGGACATLPQLDLEGGRLAALAVILRLADDTVVSEARVLRTSGGGSRALQRESESQESNYVDAVALDGGRLYTARGGLRQENVFTRLDPATGARTDARAFTTLAGGFARDGGHQYFVENGTAGADEECPGATRTPCVLVDGQDPFAADRLLVPTLSLRAAPEIVYADTPLVLSGVLARRRVDRARVLAQVPQPAVPVTVSSAPASDGASPFTPLGAVVPTGAAGDWSATIAAPVPPDTGYLAAAGAPGAIPAVSGATPFLSVWVRMAVTSAVRSAGGDVTLTGTISPPQPGRHVRLDRRVSRTCNLASGASGATPSTVGTPKGCSDRWTPSTAAASAAVSADGATFSVTRHGPAGVYQAVLKPIDAPSYEGETAQVKVP
jgi:hypothetical protein